jgi:uncharacterized protein YjdB
VWRQAQGANLITNDDMERPAMTWLKAYVNDTLTLTQSIEVSAAGGIDSIFTGDKLQMSALVLPTNTTIPDVTWSAAPSGIATIDSYGLLTTIAAGKVTVKAAAWDGSGITGTLDIIVSNRLTESITISSSGDQDSIFVDETLQMSALVLPENATNPSFTWSLSPDGLADISTSGLLIAIARGKVTVIGTANDESGVFGTLDITITEKTNNAINNLDFEKIIVYPNPAVNGNFTIRGIEKIKQIELIDLVGGKVAEFNNFNQPSIDIHINIKPGSYILRLSDGKQVVHKKITVN